MSDATPTLLGERGQIYVSLAAATTYAEQRRLRPEEARRELTELLITARCQEEAPPGGTARYRARSRAMQLDITARVVAEGRLLVVVSVEARDYR